MSASLLSRRAGTHTARRALSFTPTPPAGQHRRGRPAAFFFAPRMSPLEVLAWALFALAIVALALAAWGLR
jgi:hypothetical protein